MRHHFAQTAATHSQALFHMNNGQAIIFALVVAFIILMVLLALKRSIVGR